MNAEQGAEFFDDRFSSPDSIEHFYAQIQSVPHLAKKANLIDKALASQFQDLRTNAQAIIQHFEHQKMELLGRFDALLLPVAKELLEDLSKDSIKLKDHLDENLQNLDTTKESDWIEHARNWAHLYAKWHDNKDLTDQVLKIVSDRASQLIDRDIQLVNDYQNQSLSHLQETEDIKDIEDRLKTATSEPLKRLLELKKPPENPSPKHVSDWISDLYKKRATYFDHLLMKIDLVVKEVVRIEDSHSHDLAYFVEIEHEVKFMEQELKHLEGHFHDVEFVLCQLKDLSEHLHQYDLQHLPNELHAKVERLLQRIGEMEERVKSANK